jgi:hypothetical protein
VFVSTDATVGDIVAVRPDGTDPVRLTHGGINAAPHYQPCKAGLNAARERDGREARGVGVGSMS